MLYPKKDSLEEGGHMVYSVARLFGTYTYEVRGIMCISVSPQSQCVWSPWWSQQDAARGHSHTIHIYDMWREKREKIERESSLHPCFCDDRFCDRASVSFFSG